MNYNEFMLNYFSIIISEGCNAKCPFCIANNNLKNAYKEDNFMDFNYLETINNYALDKEIKTISISGGGEPLMMALKNKKDWIKLENIIKQYKKRDLHSNYSFDVSKYNIELFPLFTDVTVSLWINREINQKYMGYSRYDKTLELIKRDSNKANFRLSTILGKDWVKSIDDLYNYCDLAIELGTKAVTFRTFQEADHLTENKSFNKSFNWIKDRYLESNYLEDEFASQYPILNSSLRNLNVYNYKGLKVMFYKYAKELNKNDKEFLYYRPSNKTGQYNLYSDYLNDNKIISLNNYNLAV